MGGGKGNPFGTGLGVRLRLDHCRGGGCEKGKEASDGRSGTNAHWLGTRKRDIGWKPHQEYRDALPETRKFSCVPPPFPQKKGKKLFP